MQKSGCATKGVVKHLTWKGSDLNHARLEQVLHYSMGRPNVESIRCALEVLCVPLNLFLLFHYRREWCRFSCSCDFVASSTPASSILFSTTSSPHLNLLPVHPPPPPNLTSSIIVVTSPLKPLTLTLMSPPPVTLRRPPQTRTESLRLRHERTRRRQRSENKWARPPPVVTI
jgi:hypothetical protein